MQELVTTQQMIILKLNIYKMLELKKEHWEESIIANENLILQNTIQMKIAEKVIEACKIEVSKFKDIVDKEPKKQTK